MAPLLSSSCKATVKAQSLLLILLLAAAVSVNAAAASGGAAQTTGLNTDAPQKAPRRLMQYTGAVVAGSTPMQTYYPATYSASPIGGYQTASYAQNPAVPLMQNAMTTGQAPSDIASVRGRGFVRGKLMGQRIDASGVAAANIGHNQYGGITGVAAAQGQFQTNGPYGYLGGEGQARAAAASTVESGGGYTVLNGAAAAQASGSIYGGLPSGQGFRARGSASAQAEGSVMYWSKK